MKPVVCLFWAALLAAQTSAGAELVVGVLEPVLCDKPQPVAVRPLFWKAVSGWQVLDSPAAIKAHLAPELDWTVAFDGRSLGSLRSRAPRKTLGPDVFTRDYRHQVDATAEAYLRPNRKGAFTTWCDAPELRPVVLVSKPNYQDPARWKPASVEPELLQRAITAFKEGTSREPLCSVEERRVEPSPANLVVDKSYRSSKQQVLLSLKLDQETTVCNSESSFPQGPRWFLISGKEVRYIGPDRFLVDAGDYDADGESELLFAYTGYNEDGYVLMYDNLRSEAKYSWSYH